MPKLHCLLLALLTYQFALAQPRQTVSFNDGWRFKLEAPNTSGRSDYPDKDWQLVQLPHTWNRQDAFDENVGYAQTEGWYRKTFLLMPDSSRSYFIRFEAAGQQAQVFLNGQPIGSHKGGYTAFQYELTPFLIAGENTLAVRVSNRYDRNVPPLSADFTFYGGLYRDVWMITTRRGAHFTMEDFGSDGVYATPAKMGTGSNYSVFIKGKADGDLEAGSEVKQKLLPAGVQVSARLSSSNGVFVSALTGKVDKTGHFSLTGKPISSPLLWTPDSPNLYRAEVFLTRKRDTLDRLVLPVGFRSFTYTADSGLFLNGRHTKLQGTCRHQDKAGLGNALPDEVHRSDMRLLKDMRANFLRAAHYPHDPAVYEACDKLGIVVWAEIPIVNEITASDTFRDNSRVMLQEMIRQHWNHPSIFFWGYMNEVLLRLDGKPGEARFDNQVKATARLAKDLDSLARKEDPSRMTVMALHHRAALYNESGLAGTPQITGWNLYHGWYHDKAEDLGKFLDEQHRLYPKRPLMLSEYGTGSDLRINSYSPEQYDFSGQYMLRYHRSYTEQLEKRPWMGGVAIWNLVDFGSEGRKETMPSINNKGMVTMERQKKDVYNFYRVRWSRGNAHYLATRDWPVRLAHFGGAADTIEVYTNNREPVELWVDGQLRSSRKDSVGLRGPGTEHEGLLRWQVGFNNGLHKLEARTATNRWDVANLEIRMPRSPFAIGFEELAVNVGANYEYYDKDADMIWQPDRAYKPGGWGYLGGKVYRQGRNRVGIQDRIKWSWNQPLLQTMRDSLTAYRIDCPAGEYELELALCEPKKVEAALVYDLAANDKARPAATRQFDVLVNGEVVIRDFPRGYEAQENVWRKVRVSTRAGQGVNITFNVKSGGAVLSAVRLRRL